MAHDILIVDDEPEIRKQIAGILSDEGMAAREANNIEEALASVRSRMPALALLDIWLHGDQTAGLRLLDKLKAEYPSLPVVMISGHGNVETAVEATQKGAYYFIEKPFKSEHLLLVVRKALEAARLERENADLKQKAGGEMDLTGGSTIINQLRQTIDRVAPTNSRVMVSGPSGAGKDVVARLLHARSRRANGPFIMVNCATMRPETLEVELFGTERGEAGLPRKVGLFEQAHGGTLVLDEIADMPSDTQSKIVRLLHDQSFERVGGTVPVQVDVRLITTCSSDLTAAIEAKRFREDLYYRLSVVPIAVPALKDRREDIPLLAREFMRRSAKATGMPERQFGEDALAALQTYEWPGNVRQLKNVIEWLLIMTPADSSTVIHADMLPPEITATTPNVLKWERGGEIMSLPLREARELFEREYLMAQVTRFGGNISRTSNFVGMERSALHRKLKSLGISNERDRGAMHDPALEKEDAA